MWKFQKEEQQQQQRFFFFFLIDESVKEKEEAGDTATVDGDGASSSIRQKSRTRDKDPASALSLDYIGAAWSVSALKVVAYTRDPTDCVTTGTEAARKERAGVRSARTRVRACVRAADRSQNCKWGLSPRSRWTRFSRSWVKLPRENLIKLKARSPRFHRAQQKYICIYLPKKNS